MYEGANDNILHDIQMIWKWMWRNRKQIPDQSMVNLTSLVMCVSYIFRNVSDYVSWSRIVVMGVEYCENKLVCNVNQLWV